MILDKRSRKRSLNTTLTHDLHKLSYDTSESVGAIGKLPPQQELRLGIGLGLGLGGNFPRGQFS